MDSEKGGAPGFVGRWTFINMGLVPCSHPLHSMVEAFDGIAVPIKTLLLKIVKGLAALVIQGMERRRRIVGDIVTF